MNGVNGPTFNKIVLDKLESSSDSLGVLFHNFVKDTLEKFDPSGKVKLAEFGKVADRVWIKAIVSLRTTRSPQGEDVVVELTWTEKELMEMEAPLVDIMRDELNSSFALTRDP
jgi:hypothetical protein